jgi:hypothetical protein
MDSDFIQTVRYKLQKRLKRLNGADFKSFYWTLRQVWGFLRESEIVSGIMDDLERRFPDAEVAANDTLAGKPQVGETESENDAICYWVARKVAESTNPNLPIQLGQMLGARGNYNESIETFRVAYIEPLFDYIDEQIDDRRMILLLLKKFKQRCEWFRREHLYSKFKDDTGKGEKNLAADLYEYLHDQGIQFHIEPESVSGRVDLVSLQTGKDRIVADAKLFNPDRGQDRQYLIKGFRQVYDYTRDYNEPFGYIVVFKTCQQDIAIPTPHQESGVPFIIHNNKTIFILVIDLFEYEKSASKRGKLQSYEILPEEFVQSLQDQKINEQVSGP